MTFAIAARCARTGMFGVAVASSSPAVAARCAHVRAGVGAATSQNVTDPLLGPRALDLLSLGATAAQAIAVLQSGPHMEYRQVLLVDRQGGSAIHTGARALGLSAEARDLNVACAGNLLARETVPAAMAAAFVETTEAALADRLLAAMRAGLAEGGEAGPIHSAGLCLVRDGVWPVADLRIDWTDDCPLIALDALWAVYAPQMEAYVARARDPEAAPSYGVPGDP